MLLAGVNTLPFDNLSPEPDNAGIAGKLGAVMSSLDGVLFVVSSQQQGQPRSLSCTLLAPALCSVSYVTVKQPIRAEEGG